MSRTINLDTNRLLFFDLMRNLAMLLVVLYHAVAAYSTFTPHWTVHDGSSAAADMIRHLLNVFIMPVFFFIAGYFALLSLNRQGAWLFLQGKLKRVGIPWLLAVFMIIPLVRYGGELKANAGHSILPFWHYWITYLKHFGTFQIGLWTPGQTHQMHFWFLSLLLVFFAVFVLGHSVIMKRCGSSARFPAGEAAAHVSILKALFVAAVLTTLGYFMVSFLTPDLSWIMVDLLLQFQPASLILYITCFALGVIAYYRQWFSGAEFPRRLVVWVPIGLLLTAGFFIIGQDIFNHPAASHRLSPLLLLAFSFIRTLLCLTVLVILVAYSRRYWNCPSGFNQALAANSYYIYLVHIFFVTVLQDILMIWPGGPAMVKASIVFLVALPLSYGVSRLINRFPRGFVIFLCALFAFILIAKR